MANLNKVMIMGNLTRDPELRHTPKGTAVADLGVAVNRRVQDGGGGWKDETTFVDVTVWGSTAENANKYLSKGRGVFIEGRLQMDVWDDKNTGEKRSKLKVVAETLQFLPDGKGGGGGGGGGGGAPRQSGYDNGGGNSAPQSPSPRQGASPAPMDDFQEEDDIPF
ncbi:single-stranded DNA-binding protein [Luteolibacter sp. AS25]|uniref:single-stranded DNA-binding protein n=1 Tax=Luteolibacter sp. AS25 TaxID=3135776 RepID=UPI00398AEE31